MVIMAVCPKCGKDLPEEDLDSGLVAFNCIWCGATLPAEARKAGKNTGIPNKAKDTTRLITAGNFCPFSWSEFYQDTLPGCLGAILKPLLAFFGISSLKRIIDQVPCQGPKCKLWDSQNGTCIFMHLKRIAMTL